MTLQTILFAKYSREGEPDVAVLPVRLFGDPVLTTPAEPVTTFDAGLRRLVRDLDQTLYDQRGSGLAAPQVGVGLRVFAFHHVDVAGHLVNPVLDFPDREEQDGPEGCLSIPGFYFDTKRRMNVVAQGVLFIDRMDAERRKAAMRAIRHAEWLPQRKTPIKISPHPMTHGHH
jgi:peptide deformylase